MQGRARSRLAVASNEYHRMSPGLSTLPCSDTPSGADTMAGEAAPPAGHPEPGGCCCARARDDDASSSSSTWSGRGGRISIDLAQLVVISSSPWRAHFAAMSFRPPWAAHRHRIVICGSFSLENSEILIAPCPLHRSSIREPPPRPRARHAARAAGGRGVMSSKTARVPRRCWSAPSARPVNE